MVSGLTFVDAPSLEIRGLRLVSGPEREPRVIVHDLSMTIAAGERVGIVGESGSGKSLTASSVLRLLPSGVRQVEGTVLVCGIDVGGRSEREMRTVRGRLVSMIYQNALAVLNPVIPVGRQIEDAARAHLELTRDEARDRALELMDAMGIPDPARRAKDYPHQFSGGMAQRVAIAIALSCGPRLVIADEPTTGLDATVQVQVLETVRRTVEDSGASLLFISHALEAVAAVTDRIVVVHRGVVLETGPTQQVMSDPLHPYTQMLVASYHALDADADAPARQQDPEESWSLHDVEHLRQPALTEARPGRWVAEGEEQR